MQPINGMAGSSIFQKHSGTKMNSDCKVELHEESGPKKHNFVPSRPMMIVLVIALLGRVLAVCEFVAHHPRNWLFCHPYEMGFVANSLIHGLGYSSPFGVPTGPTAIVAPGYPTLIAAIFLIFGSYSFASAIVIMSLQILINLVTIWLMMRIAAEMLDMRSALISGTFWALSLPLLWIPTIFWETSISACALVGMIALALRCQQLPTLRRWIVMGVYCSLTSLINPALLPSLMLIMGWVAFQTWHISKTRPLLALLAFAVVFAPWPIRNAVRFHAFIPLRSTVGLEMFMGNRPGGNGRLDDSLFPMFNKPELASYIAKGEIAYTTGKNAQGWGYIRAQPTIFLKMTLRRVYRFWTGTGNLDSPLIYELHALLTTVLGGIGLILLTRNGRRAFAVLLALPLLIFPFPYYITHAEFRYRLNIDPVLAILAGYAVNQLCAMWAERRATVELREAAASHVTGAIAN
jgi:hypothetical protein